MKTKYLSDVLDTSLFQKGMLNVVYAPCGSGKTTAALNKIAPLASSPKKAIYLIDTKIGKERLSRKPELVIPFYAYPDAISKHYGFFEDDKKVGVTTYAQFGYWCAHYPDFAENYEYIICDELHSLIHFSKIGTNRPNEIDVHKKARAAIQDAVNRGNVIVIAITATPKPLEELECELKDISFDRTNLHKHTEKETIRYLSIESVLEQIPLGKRGGLYVKHIEHMKKYGDILRARGFNPLLIWSLSNKDHIMTTEQLIARQYIIENEAVPEEYDVFLFNETAETSINITSHMDFFIAHDTGETHITQSRGRYRGNLETLYIYDRKNGDAIVIPDEYLNRPLFGSEVLELRDKLNIKKDKHSHALSKDDFLRRISLCGYCYETTTIKRRKAYIIRKE